MKVWGLIGILEKPWGQVFSEDEIKQGLKEHRPVVLGIVQGETSTGVMQPLEGLGDLCHEYGALLLVDTVASLGGGPFFTDEWNVDVVYSGSQKCMSCPPGLAPLTLGPMAVEKLDHRKTKVGSFPKFTL